MNILAFESSCDETSASVLFANDAGRFEIKSNIIASQIETHRLYGGVVPEIASRKHVEKVNQVIKSAVSESGLDWDAIKKVMHL